MHAILALAVGAAAFGSSSSATSSEDLESIEATLDHVEEMRRRARGGLGGQLREVGDAVSALYDDGESYSATVTEVTGSDITVTYSDDDTSTYDLTESGNVVQTASGADCVTTCDSSTLDTEVWGNQWWNDPYVSQSYINFKVFSTGDVHFKPDNAEHGAVPPQQRGGSQKPAAASEVPSPKGEPVALKDAPVEKARRRLGRRGGGRIATTGSFSISSGNRSGNG
ncbi:hypothetical protein JL722_5924 [Aureococcus anophagefferens]|nr:hypothetical protein JL722_5924 [Aureococcus anophagefferens]